MKYIRNLTLRAILSATICVIAPFALPAGAIPITLASFIIFYCFRLHRPEIQHTRNIYIYSAGRNRITCFFRIFGWTASCYRLNGRLHHRLYPVCVAHRSALRQIRRQKIYFSTLNACRHAHLLRVRNGMVHSANKMLFRHGNGGVHFAVCFGRYNQNRRRKRYQHCAETEACKNTKQILNMHAIYANMILMRLKLNKRKVI